MQIMKNQLLGKALAAALLFVASSMLATTWYVSPSGSDNNAGTLAAPLATLMKAQSLASSGDTVYLNAGTYKIATRHQLHPGRGLCRRQPDQ